MLGSSCGFYCRGLLPLNWIKCFKNHHGDSNKDDGPQKFVWSNHSNCSIQKKKWISGSWEKLKKLELKKHLFTGFHKLGLILITFNDFGVLKLQELFKSRYNWDHIKRFSQTFQSVSNNSTLKKRTSNEAILGIREKSMNDAKDIILWSKNLRYQFQWVLDSTIQLNFHQFKTRSGCYGPKLTAPAPNIISNKAIWHWDH
jgi:hypothetical protein